MTKFNLKNSLVTLGLILILGGASYLRLIGVNWDQNQHLHPDERFMTMVVASLEPAKTVGEYFDTANSTLNPNNRGYGFYVYGDLPIIMVRYLADWLNGIGDGLREGQDLTGLAAAFAQVQNWAGYDEVALLGRFLSAVFDIASLIFVFLIGKRLFGNKVALLGTAFSALAVMQIQQSHFFTVDMFANFFIVLATYFAVEIIYAAETSLDLDGLFLGEDRGRILPGLVAFLREPVFWLTVAFGLAFGAAVACKVNAAPLALLLPVALGIRKFNLKDADDPIEQKPTAMGYGSLAVLLVIGGLVSIIAFRVFMPYAFKGPGFVNFSLNPLWTEVISQQRAQANGDVDFPPALQWTRRSVFYSGENMLHWGLGWPLGILWAVSFVVMSWQILRRKRDRSLIIWGWVAFYFIWQSVQWNPNMRYQLPIYPLAAIMAAWYVFKGPKLPRVPEQVSRGILISIGAVVLVLTAMWAFAFTRIYTVDHSRVQATRWILQNLPGPINLDVTTPEGETKVQPLPFQHGFPINLDFPSETWLTSFNTGKLEQITFAKVEDLAAEPGSLMQLSLFEADGYPDKPALANGELLLKEQFSDNASIVLNAPVQLVKDKQYVIRITTDGNLTLRGAALVQESSWDDGLPLRMDGYDPFGGIYQPDLNFEMYWDDNADKYNRFVSNLDVGDALIISSNRQWATTTRVPERYPLTTKYYQELIGCPPEKEVMWCYNVATPGMFKGNLGYELAETFTAYPRIFGHEFNTQFADESFTVYDATKVLIFRKTAEYDPAKVRAILGTVDLSKVIHVTPRNAPREALDLMQPAAKAALNEQGGTWAELYPPSSPLNRNPWLGLLAWYGLVFLLGAITFPFFFYLFGSLADKAYPISRLGGMLLLAYIAWLLSSTTPIPYSRAVLWLIFLGLAIAGGFAYWLQRDAINAFIRAHVRHLGTIELVFLGLFAVDLLIRIGNPDLWHPYKGGERPMDFSYLNAVLKSTTFPPYDPWFAGGYINYYYWGFVLVGTPIKLLGITPSVAYNFVLPTLFALLGIGGFSVVSNLVSKRDNLANGRNVLAGIAGAAGLVLIGNLGTIQLIYRSLQKMVVSTELVDSATTLIFQRWVWAAQGFGKLLGGEQLPIGWGDYYWAPSRVMPTGDLAITEFPLFTFLYSDLHAHMIALPLTILAVLWGVSILRQKSKLEPWPWISSLVFGGLVMGVLRPTNTWDYPTYLLLGISIVAYVLLTNREFRLLKFADLDNNLHVLFNLVASIGLLVISAQLFFQPFSHWYGMAYGKVELWTNEKTPIWSYFTHWGLFLFVIISWMAWETRQWMAETPVSALANLRPHKNMLAVLALGTVFTILAIQFGLNVPIAWFVLPLALWALILILRPDQSDENRLILFMVGTGLVLTAMVEVIVLSGDIGRMNTVFKFYLQVWSLFAISAAYAFGKILGERDQWGKRQLAFFDIVGITLLAGALLFTITGSFDKIRDRMSDQVPLTLDSMDYMMYATYWDQQELSLSKDHQAIRWMQENIKGSPVIVEANSVEYRWGTRYTIYTGLPGVAGWSWHQRQQRALLPGEWVTNRINEINNFYNETGIENTVKFLRKYNVRYIIVSELEQVQYAPEGIAKFQQFDGIFWNHVYQYNGVSIYEVSN